MIVNIRQTGYVALITVLVVGAASLAIGLALLAAGTDRQRTVLVTQQSALARSITTSCVEDALQQIHDNTSFTGTNNLSIGSNSCSYTVTNLGGTSRQIDATSTIGTIVRKTQVYATIGASSISITSWQEI